VKLKHSGSDLHSGSGSLKEIEIPMSSAKLKLKETERDLSLAKLKLKETERDLSSAKRRRLERMKEKRLSLDSLKVKLMLKVKRRFRQRLIVPRKLHPRLRC